MCGIIGNLNREKSIQNYDLEYLLDLSKNLNKRGPDHNGYYLDQSKKIYFGHLRLSIVDLSDNASQPMKSKDGRYIISFNGEIYNFKNLAKKLNFLEKKELKSDTRVLVEYLSKFGVDKTLQDINGMFAISILDRKNNKFYLARDFFGKKPIYYFYDKNNFFFSSTLDPIIKNKNIKKIINFDTTNYFFNYGFFPDGLSVFENINKVPKNSYLTLNLDNWKIDILNIYKDKDDKEVNDEFFSIKVLENKIFESVEKRLITDVPTCILLSSGIDSTLVSYYSSLVNKNITTYTVGFKEKTYDESKDSKKIAKYLGLKNETIYLDNFELKKIIQEVPDAFDEPFADSSQIPSMLIFQKISKFASACLTGDGGDEIFYGYNRYQWFLIWQKFFKKNPLINDSSKILFEKLIFFLNSSVIGKKILSKYNISNNKSEKFINIFFKKKNIYYDFLKLSFNSNFVRNAEKVNYTNTELNSVSDLRNFDINNYLVGDILTKIDRSSMHYSVEARSPLLDKNIYDYIKNLNFRENLSIFNKKILLKKILKDKIPKKILSNPKKGFSVPLEKILIENLQLEIKDFLKTFKKDERLRNLNFQVFEEITHRFFYLKDYKLSYQVWSFYVFFSWYEKYKKYINI